MMYCKPLYFEDPSSGSIIMSSKDPAVQKAQGRKVRGWNEHKWKRVCQRVAFEGNWWKFSRTEVWRNVLLGTGERELCEAGKDSRWGIGYTAKYAMQHRDCWGANMLGIALMRVREQIRKRLKEFEEMGRTDWDLPGEEMWDEV